MEQYRVAGKKGKKEGWVIQKLVPEHIGTRGRGVGNTIPAKWIDDWYPDSLPLVPSSLLELTIDFKPTSNLDDILEAIEKAKTHILANLEIVVK